MSTQESTKVTLDLSKELTADELASFQRQAELAGRSLKDHLTMITFGQRSKTDEEDAA
jgi:hypothetical protein